MSSETPNKEELAKELQRVLNTLSEEAQHAAVRKVSELGFDPKKGRISLEETLINLTQGRDILLDAIESEKFAQLPLKLQYALYDQVQAIARDLTALVTGTDAVQNLDQSVEELNASVWQFQLHNLSDQVLGFQRKMNQLKSQETAIRQASRSAEQFEQLRQKADETLGSISDRAKSITEVHASAGRLLEQLQATLRESTEIGQKVASIATQVAQQETTATQQLATAKQASADTEAIAAKSKEVRTEIDAARASLQDLTSKTQELLTATERTATARLGEFESGYEELRETAKSATTALIAKAESATTALTATAEAATSALATKLDASISELTAQTNSKLESLTTSADTRIGNLTSETSTRVQTAEAAQQTQLASQLQEFATKSDAAVQAFTVTFSTKAEETIAAGEVELKKLTTHLTELEGRIREAIERATGYTLFHAFQRRQQDIVKEKNFWAKALAACVIISLIASGAFIYSLQFVQQYNAAFYLKLSISLPIIYAIAFCNLQYSRERKLEEEYAFKSSISISLDPYQKLVANLVDKANPTELAKYSEFIIQSVNRVFTSPTGQVFEGTAAEKNSAEQIIKAVGDVIEPVVKGLRR